MKTFSKGLLAAAVLAVASTSATVVQADLLADTEVSASVGVSNLYLFRGSDLSKGSAQVWGDLSASLAGAYAGVWASSGDDSLGTEYDLYLGYGGDLGGFSYDVALINYLYPTPTGNNSPQGFADYTEAVTTVGYGPVSFSFVKDITSGTSIYKTFSYEIGSVSFLYGDFTGTTDGHFDISYAYNDNLSFTVSAGVDGKNGDNDTREPLFVVGLTLPIE
jgi:uncharacterized protein (TIGR02001 family)